MIRRSSTHDSMCARTANINGKQEKNPPELIHKHMQIEIPAQARACGFLERTIITRSDRWNLTQTWCSTYTRDGGGHFFHYSAVQFFHSILSIGQFFAENEGRMVHSSAINLPLSAKSFCSNSGRFQQQDNETAIQ